MRRDRTSSFPLSPSRLSPGSLLPGRRREAETFAALLEGDPAARRTAPAELRELVPLATALVPAPVEPSADFRAALRERLLAQEIPVAAPGTARRPAVDGPARAPRRGRRRVVAGAAAGLLAVGVGGAWASTGALPGDPLYPVKRGLEQVQLDLATGQAARGQRYLDQAGHRLGEVEALLAGPRADDSTTAADVVAALQAMRADDAAGGRLLLADYDRTGDADDLRALQKALVDQRERLTDLQPRLPAAAGPALDALLRQLGDTTTGLLTRLDRCAAACLDLTHGLAAGGLATVGPGGRLVPAADRLGVPAAPTGVSSLPTPAALPTSLPSSGAVPRATPTSSGSGGGLPGPVSGPVTGSVSGPVSGSAGSTLGGTVAGAGSAVGGTVSGVTGTVGKTVGGTVGSTVSGAGSAVGGAVGGVTGTVGGLLGGSPSPTPAPSPSPTTSSSPAASSASPAPAPTSSPTCVISLLGVKLCS